LPDEIVRAKRSPGDSKGNGLKGKENSVGLDRKDLLFEKSK
jgi:hypothetical protein